MQTSPQYWRATKSWSSNIGSIGIVLAATYIHSAAPELETAVPYSYVIVDFEGVKKEYMGVAHERLEVGDRVMCVLRKLYKPDAHELIPYGIKVKKIS